MRNRILFILTFVTVFSCAQENKNHVFANYFDFVKEKAIYDFGTYTIDFFLEDKIIFNEKHGDIRDNTLYDTKINELNFDGTYKLTNSKNEKEVFYFKFGFHSFDNRTILTYLNLISEIPKIESGGEFRVEAVNIPFLQYGKLKICTIGDSQSWWGYAGKLRNELYKQNENFYVCGK